VAADRENDESMEQNRATQFMEQGYVRSKAALLAVCQEFGIETENDIVPRLALYFAGGIGNTGAVCGAVAGAVMPIDLKLGRADTMEEALREWRWQGSSVAASRPRLKSKGEER